MKTNNNPISSDSNQSTYFNPRSKSINYRNKNKHKTHSFAILPYSVIKNLSWYMFVLSLFCFFRCFLFPRTSQPLIRRSDDDREPIPLQAGDGHHGQTRPTQLIGVRHQLNREKDQRQMNRSDEEERQCKGQFQERHKRMTLPTYQTKQPRGVEKDVRGIGE